MASISLRGVSKHFGKTQALSPIDFEIDDGEFLVLLGPSGCGKTTLLRILAGLLEPSSGQVVVGDRDVTTLPPKERDMAMVFQSYALYPHLSVARNLGFGLRVRRRPKEEIAKAVQDVAGMLKLSELLGRKPRELSGGQRQRVAVGRAIVRDPRVFLMDEPLSNLDAQLRTATRLELADLHRRLGTTFVYVTHDQVEAMTLGTKIAIMNGGRLELLGTPEEVYDEPASAFVASFIGAPPMNLIPGDIENRSGRVYAVAPGVEAPLWVGSAEACPVLIGVRPEHLRLASGRDDGPILHGTVVAVENLGSEEVAFCLVGESQVALRAPRPIGVAVGDRVVLTTSEHRIFLFDPVTTRRLVWVDDSDLSTRPMTLDLSRTTQDVSV